MKRMVVAAVVAVLGLGAPAAQASPRRLVVATGDCRDAELSSNAKVLYDVLSARPGEDVMAVAAFAQRLFPQPSGSFEDLRRQLDAAQGQFYEARYAKAAQAVDEALGQIMLLPVGDARWKLYVSAQLLQALNYRALGKVKESDAALRQVLRLEPGYQLDPDYFTPSTRQAFENLRRELARAPKVKLAVKSSLPASEVYLDGHKVGQTPLVVEVLAGTYELAVKRGAAVSFPRQLTVQGKEMPVLVDLAFEGSVFASPFPCLSSPGDEEKVLSHAVRLGGTLGVEEVIAVKLERASSGPKWLAATVLNVEGGQKLREGGFKTQGDATPEVLAALVDFVTTGKARPELVVAKPDTQPPWAESSAGAAASAPVAAGEVEPAAPYQLPESREADPTAPDRLLEPGGAPSAQQPAGPSVRPLRVVSYLTLGAGVASLAAAGGVRVWAQQDYAALRRRLTPTGGVDANDVQGVRLLRSLEQKAQWLNGLLIGSGVALATGAVLYAISPSEPPASLSVGVTPGGAFATVSGSF